RRGRDAAHAKPLAEIPRRAVAAPRSITAALFLLVVVAIRLDGQHSSPWMFPPLFSERKQQPRHLQITYKNLGVSCYSPFPYLHRRSSRLYSNSCWRSLSDCHVSSTISISACKACFCSCNSASRSSTTACCSLHASISCRCF